MTRESRTVPWSGLAPDDGPTVDPSRFQDASGEYPDHWREFPAAWPTPEGAALAKEVRRVIEEAMDTLPTRQRTVLTLRDVEGWAAGEVCNVLGISETNQRVLLHRARSRVRRALERYLAAG